jgi:hypothetical protein
MYSFPLTVRRGRDRLVGRLMAADIVQRIDFRLPTVTGVSGLRCSLTQLTTPLSGSGRPSLLLSPGSDPSFTVSHSRCPMEAVIMARNVISVRREIKYSAQLGDSL